MHTCFLLTAALLLVSVSATAQQPLTNGGLRIVIVEGEDAVNIVQQKTALAPVVEVRDRNNLPVPGAVVTFSIQGGNAATFGGASTLTVATNAAGQAAVTGLTPTAAGAVQIQVSAAFQGQIATATIAQTNVMTAAQAAAASAATGTSGSSASTAGGGAAAGGGGGGGISTTTLAVTGAAVAGGAVAATQLTKGNEAVPDNSETFTGNMAGQALRITRFRDTGVTACVETRAITGSVRVEIGNGEGRLNFRGTDALASSSCQFGSGTDNLDWSITLSVNGSAIRGTNTGQWDSVVAGVRGSTTTAFEGERRADNTITGTLTVDIRYASISVEGIVFDHQLAGSVPATVTKSSQ